MESALTCRPIWKPPRNHCCMKLGVKRLRTIYKSKVRGTNIQEWRKQGGTSTGAREEPGRGEAGQWGHGTSAGWGAPLLRAVGSGAAPPWLGTWTPWVTETARVERRERSKWRVQRTGVRRWFWSCFMGREADKGMKAGKRCGTSDTRWYKFLQYHWLRWDRKFVEVFKLCFWTILSLAKETSTTAGESDRVSYKILFRNESIRFSQL